MYRTVWAICAAALVAALFLFVDGPVGRLIEGGLARDLQTLFSNFSKNGTVLFYALFGGLYGYARVANDPASERLCRVYLTAQLIFSFALVRVLKIGIGRPRPGGDSGFNFFSLASKYNSFPSGHAADAFVGGVILYVLLEQSRWHRWRFVPLLYAALIAVGRVIGGAHHASDVVAGATIGIGGALCLVARSQSKSAQSRRAHQR